MAERIDRERSRARIERDVETLGGPAYTLSDSAICRYAYTDVYRATLAYITSELEQIGFTVWQDPVGTLIASNVAADAPAFGVGSHCDSNRNGGKYDGTLGVCTALEVCRLAAEAGEGLPLRLISFLEEEGSGFGQMLLGSRIMLQRVTEEELRETIRDEHGVSFWDAAEAAGYEPARWRESIHALDNLTGWVEVHIEQGRVLQDTATRLGIVEAIVGYIHGDLFFTGRADHAGATPMDFRLDALVPAAETVVELERLARVLGGGVVGTAGEIEAQPSLINVIPGGVRLSLDLRSVSELHGELCDRIVAFACERGEARGVGRGVRQAPGPARAADGRGRRRRARRERGGERRDVPADALGRRARHAVRGLAGAQRDGLRALRRRALAYAAGAGRPGRRGARGGGRLLRDQGAGGLTYFTRGERSRKSLAISSNVHQRTPSCLLMCSMIRSCISSSAAGPRRPGAWSW